MVIRVVRHGHGSQVIAHTGSVATRLLADRVGLTAAVSKATGRTGIRPVHDRGQMFVDVALLLVVGCEAIAVTDVRAPKAPCGGPVASAPTVWRRLRLHGLLPAGWVFRACCVLAGAGRSRPG